jgi:hypothetical protein
MRTWLLAAMAVTARTPGANRARSAMRCFGRFARRNAERRAQGAVFRLAAGLASLIFAVAGALIDARALVRSLGTSRGIEEPRTQRVCGVESAMECAFFWSWRSDENVIWEVGGC